MFYQKSIMQHLLITCSVAGTNTRHAEIQKQSLFSNSPLLYGITFSLFFKASYPDSATSWTIALQASPVHGILQARTLEWVAIPFSRGSSDPEIEPGSPALQADSLLLEPHRKPQ